MRLIDSSSGKNAKVASIQTKFVYLVRTRISNIEIIAQNPLPYNKEQLNQHLSRQHKRLNLFLTS